MAANSKSATLASASSQGFYILDASQSGLDVSGDMSISMLVNFTSLPSSGNLAALVTKWNSGGVNQRAYGLWLENSAGTYRFLFITSTNGTASTSATCNWTPTTGVWYQVGISKSGTTTTFYVNGYPVGTATSDATQFNASSTFAVGMRNDVGNTSFIDYLDGKISQAIVYSAAIGTSGMQTNAGTPYANYATNAVSKWTFDNTPNDAIGSNNLTGVNTPTYGTSVQAEYDIVRDAISNATGVRNVNSVTWSHTCSGSNRALVVHLFAESSATVTGVTYNSVAMTQGSVSSAINGSRVYAFYLLAPATGANNIVATYSSSGADLKYGIGVSYMNVKQSAQPDANNNTTASATSISVNVTTVASDAWIMGVVYGGNASGFAPSGAFKIVFWGTGGATSALGWNGLAALDSERSVATPAATAVGMTMSGSANDMAEAAISLAPYVPPAATGSNRLPLMGVG